MKNLGEINIHTCWFAHTIAWMLAIAIYFLAVFGLSPRNGGDPQVLTGFLAIVMCPLPIAAAYNIWHWSQRRMPVITLAETHLFDHRVNLSVSWADFRGVDVSTTTRGNAVLQATMNIHLSGVNGSIPIDICDLSWRHEAIVEAVRERASRATGLPQ